MTKIPGSDYSEVYLVVRTRSILACILHWTLFCSVVTLAITGLYISYPMFYYGQGEAYQAFAMANMREIHFIAATVMIVGFIARFYLAFTQSCNKDIKQFIPTPRNIVNAVKLAKYFLTLRGEHSHFRFINPLGGIGVFTMSALMLLQVITGFILYFPGADSGIWWWGVQTPLESLLGGQQNVRLIHHITLYLLTFVVLIHVYMQLWKNSVFPESDISSIIAGYKIYPLSQIGQFADYYGLRLDEKAPSAEMMDKASAKQ